MDRRTFSTYLAFCLLSASLSGEAQQPEKPRIGVLTLSVAGSMPTFEGFRQGLREHGYVEGRNISIDFRFADGRPERLPEMAAELVKRNVDVIVTESAFAAEAAKHATQTIPIVIAVHGDPVGSGLVASLARPGGNVTGLSLLAAELSGKRLQILKEVVPRASHVAVLRNSANPASAAYTAETEAAARTLGVQLQWVEVRTSADFEAAFQTIAGSRPDGLVTLPDGTLLAGKTRIVEFAAKTRIPSIFADREFVEAGGLMAYGPSLAEQFRRAAVFVDKVLKGSKPTNLPIEQATQFELAINLKTAKALSITFPPAVVQRASMVIE